MANLDFSLQNIPYILRRSPKLTFYLPLIDDKSIKKIYALQCHRNLWDDPIDEC